MTSEISGLVLMNDFITMEQEKELLEFIDSPENTWNDMLKRRTMHFGYEYNYNKKGSLTNAKEIPEQFKWLVDSIFDRIGDKNQPINQIIINEYLPGQGISSHIDANSFGDIIVSVSLGTDAIMEFSKVTMTSTKKVNVLLKRCSAIFLSGESRYNWRHSIPARKTDTLEDGTKIIRARRISMTFRHVKI